MMTRDFGLGQPPSGKTIRLPKKAVVKDPDRPTYPTTSLCVVPNIFS